MHDVVLVGDLQRVEHGERRRHGFAGGQAPVATQPLLEALAVDVLHGDVRARVGPAAVVDGHDGGVVEPGAACASMRKRSTNSASSRQLDLEHLHGDMRPQRLVLGQVHVGHAAAAEARRTR